MGSSKLVQPSKIRSVEVSSSEANHDGLDDSTNNQPIQHSTRSISEFSMPRGSESRIHDESGVLFKGISELHLRDLAFGVQF
mmetsp:Transcript_20352/g.30451  ORF Transcript_20352/g.30451 Transcript_20352/m.30451 type:complete len:82 (+) Transcript_20352:186-431(+)